MLVQRLTVAIVGATTVEAVNVLPTNGTPTSEIIKIAVQVIIGIATLVGLLKRNPKPPKA